MDFTEIYKQSSSLAAFSPGAHFILTAVQDRIIVRRTDTFQITRSWLLDASRSPTNASLTTSFKSKRSTSTINAAQEAWVSHVGWSCDSEYILAACAKRGVIHLQKLRDEEWNGRIDCGAEGLVKAEWAPDGRTILCFSEWGLRVTLWSLVTGTATYIQFPVHPDRGYAFRSDGRYFILAERHKSKETLGLYDVFDSYKELLGSLGGTVRGSTIATFSPDYDPGLGIRCVSWHPSGMFLAVGGWDDKVHLLDNLSWSPVATLDLSSRVPNGATVWREPSKWLETTEGRGFLSYERLQGPHTIPLVRGDPTKANPRIGVAQLDWNTNGSLLCVRLESTPTAVHIFDFPTTLKAFAPRLRSVLLHAQPVQQVHWNPVRKGTLALCCGSRSVYTWSNEWIGEGGEEEEIAECIGVPVVLNQIFETKGLKWAPDGTGLMLLDKDQFCCAFEVQE